MSESELEEVEDLDESEEDDDEFPSLKDIQEANNVTDLLGEAYLTRLGDDLKRNIEIDEDSRSEWKARTKEAFKLAMQVADLKSYPFDKAANVVYPLITTAALQFAQRCYPAVVPGDRVVQCAVIGDDDGMYRVEQDPETGGPVMDPETGQIKQEEVMAPGSKADKAQRVARHMSWQVLHAMPEWEPGIDQMLHYLPIAGCAFRKVFYKESNRRPCINWISAEDFICNMKAKSVREAARYAIAFELYPHQIKARQNTKEYRDVNLDQLEETEEADRQDDQAPRKFYEVYTRLDIDGDGYPEPYVIHMHEEGEILKIEANFEGQNEDGTIDPYVDCVKYTFIPNPEGGFYDVGFGWLLCSLNQTINTSINQMLDAGHWQNAPSGFLGRGIRLGKSGRTELTPNSLKTVDASGEELRKNIWIYEHPGPSEVLFSLLGLMIEAGRDISSVQDIMQGRTEKNLAPTTVATLVEQGMTTFTSIFKRVHRSLKEEFSLLKDLNSKTLPQHMYAYGDILDDPGAIAREDYEMAGMDIMPITDPKMVSDQVKQARAGFIGQLAEQGNVKKVPATKRMLEAYNIDNVEELLPSEEEDAKAAEDQGRVAQKQEALLDLQIKKEEAGIVKIEGEMRLAGIDLKRKVRETEVKNVKVHASAIKDIAGAEAAEEGAQLAKYEAVKDRQEKKSKDGQ